MLSCWGDIFFTSLSNNSLVLGDELCSGTETNSGLAIVAAGIVWLSEKQSSFIFATHLHQLSKMEIINNLINVKHYHLIYSKCKKYYIRK